MKGYTKLDEMIEKENLDLVILCTPSGIHSEQTILCAKNYINIITEKPMATNLNDGLKMVKTCEDSNVRLFVVKQNRKNPTIEILKKAIDEKRFGKIFMVHLNVFGHVLKNIMTRRPGEVPGNMMGEH